MSHLYFDHIYRVMNKSEYLSLEKLGFNLVQHETKHEGSTSRFIRFPKIKKLPGTLHFTYLEFIDIDDLSKHSKREGVCFSIDDFENVANTIPGLKVRHKNYDWYNDDKDSSKRLGWNFAERENDLLRSFKFWIINYESLEYQEFNVPDHPNTCCSISKIIFKSKEEFNEVIRDFKLNESRESETIASDIPLELSMNSRQDNVWIEAVVIKCLSLERFREYAEQSGFRFEVFRNGIYVYLPNIGYNLIIEE